MSLRGLGGRGGARRRWLQLTAAQALATGVAFWRWIERVARVDPRAAVGLAPGDVDRWSRVWLVAPVGAVKLMVGAPRSTLRTEPPLNVAVRALPAVSVIAGDALLRSSRIVPLPDPVLMVTVRVVPGPADTLVIEAPLTPPAWTRLKLPVATPETDSPNATVNAAEAELVGVVVGAIELTVGAVASTRCHGSGAQEGSRASAWHLIRQQEG